MGSITRRDFLTAAATGAATALGAGCAADSGAAPDLGRRGGPRQAPNVILCMTDDQGWGDAGYNGHPVLDTPHLDAMARNGIRFNRFYSGAPVCSPTRGSCLTGRHPYRYRVFGANAGHMPEEELTLAEALKTRGYVTGHFGKWHLGTLTKTVQDSNRGGPRGVAHYAPPWDHGFDVCFSTEAKVPTWDPMKDPESGGSYGTRYWDETGAAVTWSLDGDDSRVIMDRVIPFVRRAVEAGRPFFAVVWFHTPHRPVVAGAKYLERYPGLPEAERHFYGCLTAMDEQMGRLRRELRELRSADNTMLWFCSDNGPEGQTAAAPGSTGGLRGRKRDLFEGGVRVPGLLEWPAKIPAPRAVDLPCSTLDYTPTVLDFLGLQPKGWPTPIDGMSLMTLISGTMALRPAPIAFESRNQLALIDNRYKIVSTDGGKTFLLFDVPADSGETDDLARRQPELVAAMKATLLRWRTSCGQSRAGRDYD